MLCSSRALAVRKLYAFKLLPYLARLQSKIRMTPSSRAAAVIRPYVVIIGRPHVIIGQVQPILDPHEGVARRTSAKSIRLFACERRHQSRPARLAGTVHHRVATCRHLFSLARILDLAEAFDTPAVLRLRRHGVEKRRASHNCRTCQQTSMPTVGRVHFAAGWCGFRVACEHFVWSM